MATLPRLRIERRELGLRAWVLLVAALAMIATACASAPPPPAPTSRLVPPPSAPPSARAAPRPIIELTPLTISFQGLPIARLLPDGRTESVGPNPPGADAKFVPGPTLRGDGTIVLTKGGFTARVERNGDIHVVSPPGRSPREQLFGRISGDQLTLAGSANPWTVRIEDATIVFHSGIPPNQIEGAIGAGSRHTALVMTAAFFIDLALTSD